METQRVYELDRKELKSELQTKEVELKYNVRNSFLIYLIVSLYHIGLFVEDHNIQAICNGLQQITVF